jgi:serine/threonine protein kinase
VERIVGATVAGKYRIRRVVGAGSMGIVCEAEHLEIGKRVAIKVIDAALAGMSDIALRFRQEARAASLVESHHIVQVFDAGADDKLGLYLVMEYLTGEDLAAVLSREKRLAAETAVRIGVQVARGLSKAHEAGVVHRDLKPANIFLTPREDDEPLVKILDFGISKVIDASRGESRLKLTRAGTVVGTPQYMSPEQAQGFSVDEKTDVWALGLVLYEMLAGRPAYPELPTYEAFIIHLVSSPPDPLAKVAPWVPKKLADVVHAAIEHDLAKRIPTCAELGRQLLEAQPVPGFRNTGMSVADMADTWADASNRSPYADDAGEHKEREGDRGRDKEKGESVLQRSGTSEVPPSRTVVTPSMLEDSLSIDVDVALEASGTLPPSKHPTPRPAAPPVARVATPRETPAALARSGVRSSDEAAEGEADDAPQFFDRKSLETMGTPSSPSPSGPRSGEVASDNSREVETALTRRRDLAPPSSGRSVLEKFPLAWMALAFIALGLVVVVALAMR